MRAENQGTKVRSPGFLYVSAVFPGFMEGYIRPLFHGPVQPPVAGGEIGKVALGIDKEAGLMAFGKIIHPLLICTADPASHPIINGFIDYVGPVFLFEPVFGNIELQYPYRPKNVLTAQHRFKGLNRPLFRQLCQSLVELL